jgi:hypothetical protein
MGFMRKSAAGRVCMVSGCALAAALALLPLPALAQQSSTVDMAMTVLTPGSIVKVTDMDFGQIAQPSAAGTVVLSPSASASCTPTNGLVHSGNCQAAQFSILGRRNWRVRVRETSGTVTLNGPAGATMTMTNVTFASADLSTRPGGNGWNLGNYNIDTLDGVADFYLGGTLNVGALQTPGVYNGTVNIQIQFN